MEIVDIIVKCPLIFESRIVECVYLHIYYLYNMIYQYHMGHTELSLIDYNLYTIFFIFTMTTFNLLSISFFLKILRTFNVIQL